MRPDPLDTRFPIPADPDVDLRTFAEVEAPHPGSTGDATSTRILPTIVTVEEVAACSTR